MKCNLECPYSKPNGRDIDGKQMIICESRRWFMSEEDDCIEKLDEKRISDLKRILFGDEVMPRRVFKVFTELPTNEKMIVNMITDDQLTLEDACNLLNKQDQQIKELENKITKIEEIIDNRLDNKVIPKWDNNNELFIEEKVGYWYALRQLKKKLIREKICFKDRNIEDME